MFTLAYFTKIRHKTRWQISLLVLMCAIFAYAIPVYAAPIVGGAQQEVIVIVRPNIQEDPIDVENHPMSNYISHVIPVVFAVSGVVLAVTLVTAPALAITVLIVTALGTVTLSQLLGALW